MGAPQQFPGIRAELLTQVPAVALETLQRDRRAAHGGLAAEQVREQRLVMGRLSLRRLQHRECGRVRTRPAGRPGRDHLRGGRVRGGGPPDLRERAVVPVGGPGQAGRQRQGLPRQPGGGGRVPVEFGGGGAHELRQPGAVDLGRRGPQPVPDAVADDRVRTARAPGPRHQHLQALHAVARGVVAPDQLNQIFGPHRTAVPDRERSKQRLRAIPRNRSPPPAHIGQQGEGDAHGPSLGARPDGPESATDAQPQVTGQGHGKWPAGLYTGEDALGQTEMTAPHA